jgi:hypothetical protein
MVVQSASVVQAVAGVDGAQTGTEGRCSAGSEGRQPTGVLPPLPAVELVAASLVRGAPPPLPAAELEAASVV